MERPQLFPIELQISFELGAERQANPRLDQARCPARAQRMAETLSIAGQFRKLTTLAGDLESKPSGIEIMSLSDHEQDSDPAEFGLSEDLVTSPTHKPKATQSLDFDGLLAPALVLHEDLAKGNGGQAWPAGMILTKYILRKKQDELRNASSMFVAITPMRAIEYSHG